MPTAASRRVRSFAQASIGDFGEKGSRDVCRPETVEVVMRGLGKSYHLLGLAGKFIKLFAEPDRDGGISTAMHDQHRSRHVPDPLVGVERIAHEPAHRR